MKKGIVIFFVTISIFLPALIKAQHPPRTDIAVSIGSTLFFGDLGGANFIGRPLFFDLERSLLKPVGMLSYHYQASRHLGFRIQASYSGVAGDDQLIEPKQLFAPEWFRWYRNLNFHSKLWEVSVQAEYYLIRYEPGNMDKRWGPYLLIGAGMFHFNPKGLHQGSEVALKPLHTEGQGFPGIDAKEYKLYQPCIPMGAGLRYNVTREFIIGVEYADRKTFTDYIDDVSTDYVAQADFNNFFSNDPASAALAYELSVQSDLIDPDGLHAQVTAPEAQRGDPKDKDHYIYPTFSFAYVIGQRHVNAKSQLKCMKWGGSGGQSGVHSKKRK
ncbi:MAG: DUF6089 family protein [Chitinophagales bacterium]